MKKTKRITQRILVTFIIFITIIFVTMSVMSQITKKPFSILGTSYGVVQTPSMTPLIIVGDFVVMNEVPFENLVTGDIIAFHSVDQKVVVHEIISTEPGITTKGLNNSNDDFKTEGYITKDKYIAKVVWYGGSFIGRFLVDQRLLVIGIIVILISVIFIIQIMMLIYQMMDRQQYKYKTDLEKYKASIKENKNKRQD